MLNLAQLQRLKRRNRGCEKFRGAGARGEFNRRKNLPLSLPCYRAKVGDSGAMSPNNC